MVWDEDPALKCYVTAVIVELCFVSYIHAVVPGRNLRHKNGMRAGNFMKLLCGYCVYESLPSPSLAVYMYRDI